VAKQEGTKNRSRNKRPLLPLYFFLNDELHKKFHINRGQDLLTAWNYPASKKVKASYSTTIRRHKPAFSTTDVCKMVNRGRLTIELAMKNGMIERPQHTYGLDENRNLFQYFWREEDIMNLLEYLASVHRGRPRNDGEITTHDLPTPRELRAMINDEHVLYVKQGDTYVPTWRAKEF
jgi:hypothetical protein